MRIRLAVFLVLNFCALAIGGFLMGEGPQSDWYHQLNKAPWTPPGWSFGVAWTVIMLCFSLYLAFLWPLAENRPLLTGLYTLQWLLNVGWNPSFFYFHEALAALAVIVTLTLLVGFFLWFYWPAIKTQSLLLLPYLVWLVIATSLNGYIVLSN